MKALLAICAAALLTAGPARAESPRAWPLPRLELGMMDPEGGAAALAASAPFGLRYHYLAGGVNTGDRWQTWAAGNGSFVTGYVGDSRAAGMVPVFTYYELRQSLPGASDGDEPRAVLTNLRDGATMRTYLEDFKRLLQLLDEAGAPVVVQVEPDLWGYVQQRHGDTGGRAPAQVAATGMPELADLPDTVSGLARAVLRLRATYAPGVRLAYPISIWGTGKDIAQSNEPLRVVNRLARRSVRFYRSLHAPFDALFAEFTDRTSGYAQNHDGQPAERVWWSREDFARHRRFLARFHDRVRLPITLWQIPIGNTVMRTVDNSFRHYQDNRVQWLLDARHRYAKLRAYARAGVVALLFGPGLSDDTHASDYAGDGVTNPEPVHGNTRVSDSADDDGGFLRQRARAYYRAGALSLR